MSEYTKLQSLLETGLYNHPDKTALYFGNRSYSYRQLHQYYRRLAYGLKGNGIVSGDRVALFLPNCPEAAAAFLACYMIGAIAVPLNYRYEEQEARYVIKQTGAKLILFHAQKREIVNTLQDLFVKENMFMMNSDTLNSLYRNVLELFEFPELTKNTPLQEQHPAFILFTSGSTGNPKGVTHSHYGAYSAIQISTQALDIKNEDVVFIGKPISHAGGLQTQLMPALSVGAEVVLAMKPSPKEAVTLIKHFGVTEYGMLASDLLDFIEYLETSPCTLPTLNNSIGSGDAVPMELHHRFRDLFGWEVLEGCGMTEVGCYYAMNPRYGLRKWGSMGKPCPKTQIRIVNDQGEEVPPGEIGEIEVKTPSATIGYWNDRESSRKLFRDGYLLTGDLAYSDEQGYLWFVGRKKLMIVRRGSNISPIEVENILDQHPLVHAAVVVGMPDQHDGHVPVACIAPLHDAHPPSVEDLKSYVSTLLAAYKTPVHYIFMPELPRNATGKFDRHQLEQLVISSLIETK